MASREKSRKDQFPKEFKPEAGRKKAESLIRLIGDALEASTGEERDILFKFRAVYKSLPKEEKEKFFDLLLESVEIEPESLEPLIAEIGSAAGDLPRFRRALAGLRSAVESPRWKFFRQFIGLPGGLKFLLELRADILTVRRQGGVDLSLLDQELESLFESWFHDGFLFLSEITQDSPFRQIEIIKNGDMVHPMTRMEEMGRRLGRDRRCFALYHQAMPEEPVVFIEVALTSGIVRSIHQIIDAAETGGDDSKKDTAVFYSINNTQNGLAGLGLGKVMIFQVVDFLKNDAPQITNFCTLSPMPGFWRYYLKPILMGEGEGFKLSREELEKFFDKRVQGHLAEHSRTLGGDPGAPFHDVLLHVFSNPSWAENKQLIEYLARPLTKLGYFYLAEEKRNNRPIDPVANFHLGNEATVSSQNVNFGANWSPNGVEKSLSLMVNYVYSINWRRQIGESITRLGGFIPGLSRRFNGRRLPPEDRSSL